MKAFSSFYQALYRRRGEILGFFALLLMWRLCLFALAIDPFSHDMQDSYTLQALAWRSGQMNIPLSGLSENLELAVYQGRYFLSFPPVPTLPMWVLTFLFDLNTPSRLVNLCYFLSSYLVGYSLCRRLGKGDSPAAMWAGFLVAGCNLLNLCWSGGVWYQAQALSFLLTLSTFRLLLGKKPLHWGAGLVCLALAVGCRPFQAVYVPAALWMAYRNFRLKKREKPLPGLMDTAILCLAPGFIALAYGLYNLARFGNMLEFGHVYLPEVKQYGPMFSLSYLPENLLNVFRLPYIQDGRLDFTRFNGFAFYLVNPLFLITLGTAVGALRRRHLKPLDALLFLTFLVHFSLLLMHRTFGGWQFGTRYLIDLCPALFYFVLRHPAKRRLYVGLLMILGVLINLYGGLLFLLT